MKRVPEVIYNRIDNNIYNLEGGKWWQPDFSLNLIRTLIRENQFEWKEHRGAKPNISYLKMLRYLHKRATGELTYEEFGKKFLMVESSSTKIMYMGYALKK